MSGLSPELRDFIKPGLAGMIAAADDERRTHASRVWAARYLEEQAAVELYVLRETSARFLDDVRRSGRAAANLVEVTTYRSRAFKGRCTVSDAALDAAFLDGSLRAMNVAFEAVGMGPDGVARMLGHYTRPGDMVALMLVVDGVFDQSPKPGAGGLL